jgi:serine/threonine protein kinase
METGAGQKRKLNTNMISIGSGGVITQNSDATRIGSGSNLLDSSKNKIIMNSTQLASRKRDIKESNKDIKESSKEIISKPKIVKSTDIKSDLTIHVVTRWYRSPEIILLERDYGTPIDIWSIG